MSDGGHQIRSRRSLARAHAVLVRVDELDATNPAEVDGWHEVHHAVAAADAPDLPPTSRQELGISLRHPWPGEEHELWVAREGDRIVGTLRLAMPYLDNTDNVSLDLEVHPQFRRRGAGRALFDHAVVRTRMAGRRRLMAEAVETYPGGPARNGAGSAFAAAMGAKRVLDEVRRKLDLSTLDRAVLDRQLAEAWRHADGYSLIHWRDRAPEDVLDALAVMDGRMVLDAPMGDLAWEPEKVDAARERAMEEAQLIRHRRNYHTGTRHDASGELVGWTTITFNDEPPEHAWQQITIVLPEHRGRRLGTVLKLANLAYARAAEPALEVIDTWNAAANAPMIAVNEAMGFRPVDQWADWQLEV